MHVKPNYLEQHLPKKAFAIYWLAGQDIYLLEESTLLIKKYLRQHNECDEKVLYINNANDWQQVIEEANSYSLFSETTLLTVIYEKKTLDAAGKKILTNYLKNNNSRCALIIKTPNISAKQLQWATSLDEVLFVMHYPLTSDAMNGWIKAQLQKKSLRVATGVIELIQQYTQGNMLACAQLIEKLSLNYLDQTSISAEQVKEHLYDQCEHTLFELIDACLLGHSDKAIQVLRHAAQNKTEATLVLWMLAQETRLLLQLHYLIKTSDLKSACSTLKIWPQRINMYQVALRRINDTTLHSLLHQCNQIDECIKSNLNTHTWSYLERAALVLCKGTPWISV